jgi:hypothetical protein
MKIANKLYTSKEALRRYILAIQNEDPEVAPVEAFKQRAASTRKRLKKAGI